MSDFNPRLIYIAGMEVSKATAIRIPYKKAEEPTTSKPVVPVWKQPMVEWLFRTALQTRQINPPAVLRELRNFEKSLENDLVMQIRKKDVVAVERLFDRYEMMLTAALSYMDPNQPSPHRGLFRSFDDDSIGQLDLDLPRVLDSAAVVGDVDVLIECFDRVTRYSNDCLRSNQLLIMEDFLTTATALYHYVNNHGSYDERLAKRFDDRLGSFVSQMFWDARRPKRDGSPSNFDSGAVDVVIRMAMRLIKNAMQFEQAKDAANFTDRLFDDPAERRQRGRNRIRNERVRDDEELLLDMSAVGLLGWAHEVLSSPKHKDSPAAREVFDRAKNELPDLHWLMAERELIWEDRPGRYAIEGRLGIENWSVEEMDRDWRSGEVYIGSRDSGFQKGFWLAMLLARDVWAYSEGAFDPSGPPNRYMWDSKKAEEDLKRYAADPILGRSLEQLNPRIEKILTILKQREFLANAAWLRRVIDEPLSEELTAKFRNDAVKKYLEKERWVKAYVDRSGPATNDPIPTTISRGQWVPREYFIPGNNWGGGTWGLDEQLERREAMDIVHPLELNAPSAESTIHVLGDISSAVQQAADELHAAGYSPDTVILPNEERFTVAFFKLPRWQIPEHAYGEGVVGKHAGLTVLQCPYSDTESIIVLDMQQALVRLAEEHVGTPTVTFDETLEGTTKAINAARAVLPVKRAKFNEDTPAAASDESIEIKELPDSHSIQVLARMECVRRVRLADIRGARKIDVLETGCSFVLDPDRGEYHKPDCLKLEDRKKLLSDRKMRRVAMPRDAEDGKPKYKPCKECDPGSWDILERKELLKKLRDEREEREKENEGPSEVEES